jgi:putative ABC transport system substrate-binding protein
MRRRQFITGLGSTAAWPMLARAQQQMPVIGFLDWATRKPETGPELTGFRQGLAAVGYIEKQNVAIEFREANGQFRRQAALAAELVRRRVSVMVVINSRNAVFDAKSATSEIPIVFVYGGDPVRDGIVASLNQPGNNITGITRFNSELGGKRLSLLLSLMPQAKTIAFLGIVDYNVQQPDQQDEQLVALARQVGLKVIILQTRDDTYESAFQSLVENPAEAMIIGNFTFLNRR